MNRMIAEDGMNVVTVGGFGDLHIFVKNGDLSKVTIFNARVTKKKTHVMIQHGEKLHHVDLKITVDDK